jgi:6-phosphogluconolactonase (cycloisomerase 2 family)
MAVLTSSVSYFQDGVLYILLELTSEITAFRFPPLPAEPSLIATVPTMSQFPGNPEELGMLAAEILLPKPNASYPSPYLYATNRNDPSPEGDVIAVFSVANPDKLELVAEVRSGLKHLRGMLFGGADDRYLVAGGARGGGVKIFERVDGGKSLKEIASIQLEAPTGFLWA